MSKTSLTLTNKVKTRKKAKSNKKKSKKSLAKEVPNTNYNMGRLRALGGG